MFVMLFPYVLEVHYQLHSCVQLLRFFFHSLFGRFWFTGRFIGLAIIKNYLVDVFFARHIYKILLGRYSKHSAVTMTTITMETHSIV